MSIEQFEKLKELELELNAFRYIIKEHKGMVKISSESVDDGMLDTRVYDFNKVFSNPKYKKLVIDEMTKDLDKKEQEFEKILNL